MLCVRRLALIRAAFGGRARWWWASPPSLGADKSLAVGGSWGSLEEGLNVGGNLFCEKYENSIFTLFGLCLPPRWSSFNFGAAFDFWSLCFKLKPYESLRV
jgi:hypothetical protein